MALKLVTDDETRQRLASEGKLPEAIDSAGKYIEKHGKLSELHKAFDALDILNPMRAHGFRCMILDHEQHPFIAEYEEVEFLYDITCDMIPCLYSRTRLELAETFDLEELYHVIMSMEECELCSYQMGRQIIPFATETSGVYPDTAKGKMDRNSLITKLQGLTAWELTVMELWGWLFWKRGTEGTYDERWEWCENFGKGIKPHPIPGYIPKSERE